MNRICPSEEILSEYISGILSPADKSEFEKHLAACTECRQLLAEVHDCLDGPDIRQIYRNVLCWVKKNRWLIGAATAFLCSFLFPGHFLQFLAACLILGIKWVIDAKTAKMLIMVYEAWKSKDKEKKKEVKT